MKAEQAKYIAMAARELKTRTSNPVTLDAIEQVAEIIEAAGEKLTTIELQGLFEDSLKQHKAQGGRTVGVASEITMKRRLKTKDLQNGLAFLAVLGDKLLKT